MIVWLASYPRSGNTFFRVILNSVFDIKTYSIENDTGDIGADDATTEIVGHTLLPKDFNLEEARESNETYYIKTHYLLENMILDDRDKVIYLIRDGRESTLSFAKHRQIYYNKTDNLTDVIYGNTLYKSWGEHVKQWTQLNNYLLIKFEELTDDPTSILKDITNFLNVEPINQRIPTFQELQKINPKFFRSGKKNSWKNHFSKMEHLAFWLRNYEEMTSFGYTNDMPDEVNDPFFQTCILLFDTEINAIQNNIFNDQLINEKINVQDQKINDLSVKIDKLTTAIHNLIKIKFIKNPLKKYQYYKDMLKTYYEILRKEKY